MHTVSTYLLELICFCVSKALLKKLKFFFIFFFASNYLFMMFSDYFDVLMSKINFKK
jgi:hypothetical protein